MNLPGLAEEKSLWWKEPMVWLIIGLPVSAVVGAILTLVLASANRDVLLEADYVKQGFAVHSAAELEQRATQLGVEATLGVEAGELVLLLKSGAAQTPKKLLLVLNRPPHDGGGDSAPAGAQLTLHSAGEGRYAAALPLLEPDRWQLAVDPPDHDWRLAAEWAAPFTGILRLPAGSRNSSTPP